jgi:hypothetical protein
MAPRLSTCVLSEAFKLNLLAACRPEEHTVDARHSVTADVAGSSPVAP